MRVFEGSSLKKGISLVLINVAGAMLNGCLSDTLAKKDAQQDILVATLYKNAECGTMPGFPLPVFTDQDTNAVAGCVMAIIDAPCPFTEYPLLCIRLFGYNVTGTVRISKD